MCFSQGEVIVFKHSPGGDSDPLVITDPVWFNDVMHSMSTNQTAVGEGAAPCVPATTPVWNASMWETIESPVVAPVQVRAGDLTLPMLGLLSSKSQERNACRIPSEPSLAGTHWKALAEYFQMSCQGFSYFSGFFTSFCNGQISHQQHKG